MAHASLYLQFLADVAKQRLLIGNDGKLEQKKKRKRMPREKGSRKKQAVERDVSGHQEGEDAPEGRQDPYNEDIHISQVIPIQRNNRRTSNLEDCYNEPESQGDSEFGRFEIAECPIIEPNEQKVTQTDNNNKGGQGAGNEEFAAVTVCVFVGRNQYLLLILFFLIVITAITGSQLEWHMKVPHLVFAVKFTLHCDIHTVYSVGVGRDILLKIRMFIIQRF